jgi:hypothetical protein
MKSYKRIGTKNEMAKTGIVRISMNLNTNIRINLNYIIVN